MIQRYSISSPKNDWCYTTEYDGEWVKWEDVMKILLKISKLSNIQIMDNEGRLLI